MLRRISIVALLLLVGAGRGQSASSSAKELTGQAAPNAVHQGSARQMIRKIFAAEFAKTGAADRKALAKMLLMQGMETKDDLAARYVALADAADLAAGAGDATTAVAAVTELAKTFAVQELELRRAALTRAHAAAVTATESEAVMRLALETADIAVAVDAFDAVEQMANLAEAAANKTKQVRVAASIQVRLGMLRELTAEFAQVKQAFARLAKNEADAEAHLVIGKFYALHKGQWAVGLPHLAAGGDAELSALAAKELAKPADGLAQAALGDAWWEYAEKSNGLTRSVVNAHATEWYKTAQATIQGITLARIQARISGGEQVSSFSSNLGIDLLGLIDVQKDGAQGSWTRSAEGVNCASSAYACMRLPYEVPEEYDLKTTFTRTQGKGQIALLLAANKKAFGFALDISGEARFEMVNGKAAKDNPTIVPVAVSNEHRYTLTVEVRKTQVRALLDGKELVTHKTDYKDLSRYSVWKLGDNSVCGIGANNAKVTFHTVELIEATRK